jgi:ATP-dependent DNA helicase RecG
MSLENQHVERKSLRLVLGRSADWNDIAKVCVCFANSDGGRLLIGIEDGEELPPAGQRIPADLPETVQKRIGELTVNVKVFVDLKIADNGAEFIEVSVLRSAGVASTSDGRYFLRVADTCQPVLGDDVLRLADERPGLVWEAMNNRVPRSGTDGAKFAAFVAGIRASDRVKASVKEKSADELLDHYGLADGDWLTHLGVLLAGMTADRRRLGTAPLVQAIKYDERGQKINKWLWDDCELSPLELPDAIWREVADFRESYEIPEGLYRRSVPAYDEKVVRELLVNALVHRPYTQRGDIYLNLHPDRLEVVNPGRLPLGVTPRNLLHASRRRNEGLARVFHDLGLMEREGSGYDLIYDRLLSQGRPVPVIVEGADWVKVSIERRILRPELLQLLEEAEQRFQLTQRERICLGVLALKEASTAREMMQVLELDSGEALKPWLGRLPDFGLVRSSGRTQATRYFVEPKLLQGAGLATTTTLKRIEPHRLLALIREDLRLYPEAKIGEIQGRIGPEINRSQLKRALAGLVAGGEVAMVGERSGARYRLKGGDE